MRKQGIDFGTMDRAVIAVIEHRSVTKAAAALGIHPVTLWRWPKMPHFREQLREAQHQLYSRELSRLQQLASAAVDAIEKMLRSPETPPSTRLHVAKYVLEQSMRPFAIEEIRLGDASPNEPVIAPTYIDTESGQPSEDLQCVKSLTVTRASEDI